MSLLLYQLLFPLIALGVLGRLVLAGRSRSLRESLADLRERLGLPSEDALKGLEGPLIWVHAASVGEMLAAAPLLRELGSLEPKPAVLVTASTRTGREKARSLPGAAAAMLAPMDFYPAVALFLSRVRPHALILIETELWPMTLALASRRGVRLGLANGRMTSRAFGRYRLGRLLFAPLMARLERAGLQTADDELRYVAMGLDPRAAAVTGNMKYDLSPPSESAIAEAGARLKALWGDAPRWVAGSTRPGEEEAILKAHRRAAERVPGLKLVLAPRHPERAEEVAALLKAAGLSYRLWSASKGAGSPECLLIDELGALGALYGAGDVAFVGGTLVPVGGHNVLEPAFLGRPVLFGPHTESVADPARALESSRGGRLVRDDSQIADALAGWLAPSEDGREAGRRAQEAARSFAGATRRTLEHLRPLLER